MFIRTLSILCIVYIYYNHFVQAIEEADLSEEDIENMAKLELESNAVDADTVSPVESPSSAGTKKSGGFRAPGAMPTDASGNLSSHAAEFWFPESRNCGCCKGYKHGCDCCKGEVKTCTDAGCTTTEAPASEAEKAIEPVKDRPKPKVVFKKSAPISHGPGPTASMGTSTNMPTNHPVGGSSAMNTGGMVSICKFFNSPAGCRNGNSCQFRHEIVGPGGPSMGGIPYGAPYGAPMGGSPQYGGGSPLYGGGSPPYVGGPGPQAIPCTYFAQGTCRNGANCRFSHVLPPK